MERNGQRGASTNFFLLLAAGAVAYGIAGSTQSQAAQISSYLMGFGVLVTLVSWIHMRLEEQERLEQLEFEEVSRGGRELLALQHRGVGNLSGPAQP